MWIISGQPLTFKSWEILIIYHAQIIKFSGLTTQSYLVLQLLKQLIMISKVLVVVQYINIALTIIFLLAYLYRIFNLRHFALTELYKQKFPWPRAILCGVYSLFTLPFLGLTIYFALFDNINNQSQFWTIEFGVGEIVDSIILIMQLITLRQQLRKQRPYTPLHIIFSIYLLIVSLIRLVFSVIIIIQVKNSQTFVFMAFYLVFMINSTALFGYWIAKRQELPQFQNKEYFTFNQIHTLNETRNIMHRNIEISQMRKTSGNFNYIIPTVTVEKNKFRIILETSDFSNDQNKQEDVKSSISTKKITYRTNRLRLISNKIYEINDILQLYKICGRFSIKQKLSFHEVNLEQMYKSLQKYLQQLFRNKKNYLSFVLRFFEIQIDTIEGYDRVLRDTFKDSQLDIYAQMDRNSPLVSINIFKQLLMDDYYLFYIDVVAADGSFEARSMKRYNDFEMFHHQLTMIIKKKYGGKYQIPNLPKKYIFNGDQTKITQRRIELQSYLRNMANDYKLMIELPEVRNAVLEFLGLTLVRNITPVDQIFKNFYKNLSIIKGSISKQLTSNDYFKVTYNGIPIRTLKKRFNEFVELHQHLQRWMNNTEISYKFLVLPQKHLYKSGTDRHEKLRVYLESLVTISDIWRVYPVNSFFKVGNNTIKDISMSRIDNPNFEDEEKLGTERNSFSDSLDFKNQRFIDEDSIQSKGRMSALIQQLGN